MHRFAGNFTHDRSFARTEWLCRCGNAKEEESHLLSGNCGIYGDIREKYETDIKDDDLVMFFTEVLDRRDQLEEEEKEAL